MFYFMFQITGIQRMGFQSNLYIEHCFRCAKSILHDVREDRHRLCYSQRVVEHVEETVHFRKQA